MPPCPPAGDAPVCCHYSLLQQQVCQCSIFMPMNKPVCICQTIASLFSRLETDAQRKKKERWRKKVYSCTKVFFCCHEYSTDLIGHIPRTSEPSRKKSRWSDESAYSTTNKLWRKKTKLSVSSLRIKSPSSNHINADQLVESRVCDRKVANSLFDPWTSNAPLFPWRMTLCECFSLRQAVVYFLYRPILRKNLQTKSKKVLCVGVVKGCRALESCAWTNVEHHFLGFVC